LQDVDITYYQSPISLSEMKDRLSVTHSYSDIIFGLGYDSVDALAALVTGWRNLFTLIKPDLVMCDHSPTALLSSHCMGIKTCTFGNGFFVSPDTQQPVLFQDTDQASVKAVLSRYKLVLNSINGVLTRHKRDEITTLYDVFRHATHFLCTSRETDHYQREPETRYHGPRSTTQSVKNPDTLCAIEIITLRKPVRLDTLVHLLRMYVIPAMSGVCLFNTLIINCARQENYLTYIHGFHACRSFDVCKEY
jgi:hypothetical protein